MQATSFPFRLAAIWREEFRGYNAQTFQQDLLAGLTVGAVALPLALAFGVASGATPAWRMNEWESIHFFARRRLRHALAGMLVTMLATVALDLTQAILIGMVLSTLIYLRQSAMATAVIDEPVNLERMRSRGYQLARACPDIHVFYLTGPLFFGSVNVVLDAFSAAHGRYRTIVLSMRGVPMIDIMGIHALERLVEEQRRRGGDLFFAGLQPAVRQMIERAGLLEQVGEAHICWSAVEAIVVAHNNHAQSDCPHCRGLAPLALVDEPLAVVAMRPLV